LRRTAALLSIRPDLEVVPLRGNVPTRVGRVERGEVDAALLAMAGLKRLGLAGRAVPMDPTIFVPAPGQGAIGIQIRAADSTTRAAIAPLDDPEIRIAVEAERSAMAELEGGCRVPLGINCVQRENSRTLYLRVYAPDGSRSLGTQASVDARDPRSSGIRAARELLAAGAAELIRESTSSPSPSGRGGKGER
jgi:hydroxymethylbilane synthase